MGGGEAGMEGAGAGSPLLPFPCPPRDASQFPAVPAAVPRASCLPLRHTAAPGINTQTENLKAKSKCGLKQKMWVFSLLQALYNFLTYGAKIGTGLSKEALAGCWKVLAVGNFVDKIK